MAGDRAGEIRGVLERRREVLESLAEEPRTQAEIARAVDVSRATVTRAMDELGSTGLVERDGSAYRPTRLGRELLGAHERYVEIVAALVEVGSLLGHIPPSAPFDPTLLVDGEYHETEPGASFQVRERVSEAFRDAEAIRGMGRTRSSRESGTIHRQKVLEEERPVDSVLSRQLYEHIRDLDWAGEYFAAENLSVRVHESVPYGLFVLDRPTGSEMVMVWYDSADAMKGVIRSSTPRSLAWAESVFESYREAATPLSALED